MALSWQRPSTVRMMSFWSEVLYGFSHNYSRLTIPPLNPFGKCEIPRSPRCANSLHRTPFPIVRQPETRSINFTSRVTAVN